MPWYDRVAMKKIHRFLVATTPQGNSLTITESDIVHLTHTVLKLKQGEECIVFADKSDDYLCVIENISKHSIDLVVQKTIPKKIIPKKVTACISITKRDTFEIAVQKLTELGIHSIVPIISDRTIKQALRIDRLQKISDEALEQSGGSHRVHISEPLSLSKALEAHKNVTQYYFDGGGELLPTPSPTESVFYIGPEGGWTDTEYELFKTHHVSGVQLGVTTLRAETAAIVATDRLIWR